MKHHIVLTETITLANKMERVKEYYKKRPWILFLNMTVTIAFGIISLFFSGILVTVIVSILGITASIFIPSYKEKTKEIYRD